MPLSKRSDGKDSSPWLAIAFLLTALVRLNSLRHQRSVPLLRGAMSSLSPTTSYICPVNCGQVVTDANHIEANQVLVYLSFPTFLYPSHQRLGRGLENSYRKQFSEYAIQFPPHWDAMLRLTEKHPDAALLDFDGGPLAFLVGSHKRKAVIIVGDASLACHGVYSNPGMKDYVTVYPTSKDALPSIVEKDQNVLANFQNCQQYYDYDSVSASQITAFTCNWENGFVLPPGYKAYTKSEVTDGRWSEWKRYRIPPQAIISKLNVAEEIG